MYKNKKKFFLKKGFSLPEILISMTLLLTFLAMITQLVFNFTESSNSQYIKAELDMDLRKAIERLEKEITPARNILTTSFVNGKPYNTSGSEIVFEMPAYDANGYPMYEESGDPMLDIISIKMVDDPGNWVFRKDPVTNTSKRELVKKLVLSLGPVAGSRRSKIHNQAIFTHYLPINALGVYKEASDGSIPADNSIKLFTYYGLDANGKSKEITDTSQLDKARTIKIVLVAEKSYGLKYFTAKREVEIRLRNSTN